MSRGVFNSSNKTTEVFTFKTNSDSGTTFTPQIYFLTSGRRSHVDYGDGSVGYEAGEIFNHTYSDAGTVKDVKFYANNFSDVNSITLIGDNVYGELDLTINFLTRPFPDISLMNKIRVIEWDIK